MADDIQAMQRTDVAPTTNGPVRGYREGKLHVFKGLRYGAPPIGALRFKPPVKPQPWKDVADAITLGAPAVQSRSVPGEVAGGRSGGDPPAPGSAGIKRGLPIHQCLDAGADGQAASYGLAPWRRLCRRLGRGGDV